MKKLHPPYGVIVCLYTIIITLALRQLNLFRWIMFEKLVFTVQHRFDWIYYLTLTIAYKYSNPGLSLGIILISAWVLVFDPSHSRKLTSWLTCFHNIIIQNHIIQNRKVRLTIIKMWWESLQGSHDVKGAKIQNSLKIRAKLALIDKYLPERYLHTK